jgi:RNA polymerase sigma-70 factor (ECF subfamily)
MSARQDRRQAAPLELAPGRDCRPGGEATQRSRPGRTTTSLETEADDLARTHSAKSLDDRWNGFMAAAQAGDDQAYERLMAEIRQWLSRYFHKRLPPAAAEDATQEALIAIHAHKQKYQPDDPMTPWLRTIARFKWIDQLRSHFRGPDRLDDADVPVADHGPATRSAILLDLLLAQVKPAQALVIRLVKLNGATVEEASQITGQSASLVKVNIHRGLKRIGQALNAPGDEPLSL